MCNSNDDIIINMIIMSNDINEIYNDINECVCNIINVMIINVK